MIEFLGSLNPHLAVFLASLIPVLEAQAAIPLGLLGFKLSVATTVFWTLVAAVTIPALVLPLAAKIVQLLMGLHPKSGSFISAFLDSRVRQHSASFDRWGGVALALFIAIPGPFTGVWSATILAYLFGIRYPVALLSIFLGSVASSAILVLLVLGGRQLVG